MSRQNPNERGVIALFLASIMAILLTVTTASAARLTISELSQSSQVDRSEEAYYAAEAGIEEASRRIDQADANTPLHDIFPEQYQGCFLISCLTGDYADLSASPDTLLNIQNDPDPTSPGDAFSRSWRKRKVYDDSIPTPAVQIKDESIQIDATQIKRKCVLGNIAGGGNPVDCDSSNIFGNFGGIQYCWSPLQATPDPQIELTVVSYTASNPGDILTEKAITITPGTIIAMKTGLLANDASLAATFGTQTFSKCFQFKVSPGNNTGRRFIFRIRPLYDGVGTDQNYSLGYYAQVLDNNYNAGVSSHGGGPLYASTGDYIIDVIGHAGDVRRRMIAKKHRNDRILGIFDYVLYSGDPNYILCKPGVPQNTGTAPYDIGTCTVTDIAN